MVELVETAKGNGGDTLFESMVRWCNEEISKLVLGQTMTTENGSSTTGAWMRPASQSAALGSL